MLGKLPRSCAEVQWTEAATESSGQSRSAVQGSNNGERARRGRAETDTIWPMVRYFSIAPARERARAELVCTGQVVEGRFCAIHAWTAHQRHCVKHPCLLLLSLPFNHQLFACRTYRRDCNDNCCLLLLRAYITVFVTTIASSGFIFNRYELHQPWFFGMAAPACALASSTSLTPPLVRFQPTSATSVHCGTPMRAVLLMSASRHLMFEGWTDDTGE